MSCFRWKNRKNSYTVNQVDEYSSSGGTYNTQVQWGSKGGKSQTTNGNANTSNDDVKITQKETIQNDVTVKQKIVVNEEVHSTVIINQHVTEEQGAIRENGHHLPTPEPTPPPSPKLETREVVVAYVKAVEDSESLDRDRQSLDRPSLERSRESPDQHSLDYGRQSPDRHSLDHGRQSPDYQSLENGRHSPDRQSLDHGRQSPDQHSLDHGRQSPDRQSLNRHSPDTPSVDYDRVSLEMGAGVIVSQTAVEVQSAVINQDSPINIPDVIVTRDSSSSSSDDDREDPVRARDEYLAQRAAHEDMMGYDDVIIQSDYTVPDVIVQTEQDILNSREDIHMTDSPAGTWDARLNKDVRAEIDSRTNSTNSLEALDQNDVLPPPPPRVQFDVPDTEEEEEDLTPAGISVISVENATYVEPDDVINYVETSQHVETSTMVVEDTDNDINDRLESFREDGYDIPGEMETVSVSVSEVHTVTHN